MSIVMSEDGEIEHPADVLDEMRERFLMHGTRSPFNWVLRLRAYGKRIRNSTTSLGYIYWSDDHEKLTYKQLEMTMAGFKGFVRTEVALTQSELEQLFLVYYAPWYQPPILPTQAIAHPAPKTRACNANRVLILSRYSLV
jgi:hypothetical protein